jgi:hypothetical protein
MGGDLDHSDFVDPDYERLRRSSGAAPSTSTTPGGATGGSAGGRPLSRDEINQQVTAAQQALIELKRRQEDLERERAQLEEARRRRIEYEQGREEMLTHLTRGIALLDEAEQTARRDAEQMSRSLTDLRTALDKVSALNESSWTAEAYHNELTRALTTLESARMEWNSAQVKWPVLTPKPNSSGGPDGLGAPEESAPLFQGKSPSELARLGLALTWPVALAVLVVGTALALVLARR